MSSDFAESLRVQLAAKSAQATSYATEAVDLLLNTAPKARASDIHFQPTPEGCEIRWRIDGVLHEVAKLPAAVAPKVVARLKVLADLLTYKSDLPQEGRIRSDSDGIEMRLSTFPTLHGEKAVVRVFSGSGNYERLGDLGLPPEILSSLQRLLTATSGAILFCGPAGSGKTTTNYACLRELVSISQGNRSLTTLEDPIEVAVPGVSQSQVNPSSGFSLVVGLRSLLRQDPEVIAIGEIRDRETAEIAFQASLTGHLVLSTFHAGSAAGVIGRLSDMGIEPYLLRSGLLAIVAQRLVRRLCPCARKENDPRNRLGLPVGDYHVPTGCPACGGTGYHGRFVLVELLEPQPTEVGRAILSRIDVPQLQELARAAGMVSLLDRAIAAVDAGVTSPAEVRRVLGFGNTHSE